MPGKLLPEQCIAGMNGLTVGDFWSWAYSDILSNCNRAIFAEFIVGSALEVIDKPRVEWDAVDLRYRGKLIEVKSAAYVQSWGQSKPSTIKFDIAKKYAWDAETNTSRQDKVRSADCYVFCLYPEKNRAVADVLDIPSWQFFVVLGEVLDTTFGDQKGVALSGVVRVCANPSRYGRLKEIVDEVLFPSGHDATGFR